MILLCECNAWVSMPEPFMSDYCAKCVRRLNWRLIPDPPDAWALVDRWYTHISDLKRQYRSVRAHVR